MKKPKGCAMALQCLPPKSPMPRPLTIQASAILTLAILTMTVQASAILTLYTYYDCSGLGWLLSTFCLGLEWKVTE